MPKTTTWGAALGVACFVLTSWGASGCAGSQTGAAGQNDGPSRGDQQGGEPNNTAATATASASPDLVIDAATRQKLEGLIVSDIAKAVVRADGRTDEDRETDKRRHPEQLLTFLALTPGMRVADLGAGSGYTTELLARSIGPSGRVFAQNNAYSLERFLKEKWPARLKREVMKDVVRLDREYDDPLTSEANDLDCVTILFSYHDVIAQGHSVDKLNAAVLRALKPGGQYIVADHTAPAGSGLTAPKALHRIEESLVRKQVEAAGFTFDADAQFLRDPEDDLSAVSYKIGFKTDRFVLKFRKPK